MSETKPIRHAVAYIGSLPYLSHEDQFVMCRDAVNEIGVDEQHLRVHGPNDWDEYIRTIRSDEVAVVARLMALNERPLPPNESVGGAFLLRLADVENECLFVLDAESGLRSTDKKAWSEHRRVTHAKVRRWRKLSSKKAKEMRAAVGPGIVAHWKTLEGKAIYRRVGQHWRDPLLTANEAIENAPEEAGDLRHAKRKTWERIFGNRGVRPYRGGKGNR